MSANGRSWWAWVPVVVIAAAAIPNGIMIANAVRLAPAKEVDRAWERSKTFDQDKASQARFVSAGLELEATATATGARLTVTGPASSAIAFAPFAVTCFRPDDASLDRQAEWSDPGRDLVLGLPRSGHWRFTLHAAAENGRPVARVDGSFGGAGR